MVGIKRIEELVSREKKIFRFLVFYLFLALFLILLFLNSGGWIFMETAIVVLLMEIVITGFIGRGKPLHTNENISNELNKIDEIDEYIKLRDEYVGNKDNTIAIALTVYSLGAIIFLFFRNFSMAYITLSVTGLMVLYFSVYLFFRYKINKITMILLERRKVIQEMRKEKRREKEEMRKKREERKKRMERGFNRLKRLTKIGKRKTVKKKASGKKKKKTKKKVKPKKKATKKK